MDFSEIDKTIRFAHALALLCEARALAKEMGQNPSMERRVEILERMFAIREEVNRDREGHHA